MGSSGAESSNGENDRKDDWRRDTKVVEHPYKIAHSGFVQHRIGPDRRYCYLIKSSRIWFETGSSLIFFALAAGQL
jgi:hypothetical protein